MKVFFDFSLIVSMSKYAVGLYLQGIVSQINIYGTNLLTALYLTSAEVAFFSMAKGRAEMLTRMIPGAVASLLFPKLSKKDSKDAAEFANKSFRLTLLLLIVVGISISLFIKPIIYILYGPEYAPIVKQFILIIPSLVIFQSAMVFNSFFSAFNRTDLLYKILIIPTLSQVIMCFILMNKFGLIGASLSFVVLNLIFAFLQIMVYLRISSSSIKIVNQKS